MGGLTLKRDVESNAMLKRVKIPERRVAIKWFECRHRNARRVCSWPPSVFMAHTRKLTDSGSDTSRTYTHTHAGVHRVALTIFGPFWNVWRTRPLAIRLLHVLN